MLPQTLCGSVYTNQNVVVKHFLTYSIIADVWCHGRTHNLLNPLVESLEKAVSEGKSKKAHDLVLQILERPHLASDFRVPSGSFMRELYEEAAEIFHRWIHEHPEVFEAYYNLGGRRCATEVESSACSLAASPQQSKAEVLASSYLRGKVEESQ